MWVASKNWGDFQLTPTQETGGSVLQLYANESGQQLEISLETDSPLGPPEGNEVLLTLISIQRSPEQRTSEPYYTQTCAL